MDLSSYAWRTNNCIDFPDVGGAEKRRRVVAGVVPWTREQLCRIREVCVGDEKIIKYDTILKELRHDLSWA